MNKVCKNCGKETKNPSFCSQSCSTSLNNRSRTRKRAKKLYKCKVCEDIIQNRRTFCDKHIPSIVNNDLKLSEAIYEKLHRSNAFALVRTRARWSVRSEPQICEKCGYSKHVEVAHIKPISDFPEDTLLSVINDRNNLMLLCPNCHWEFDHPEI
jgi:hypothetical protein